MDFPVSSICGKPVLTVACIWLTDKRVVSVFCSTLLNCQTVAFRLHFSVIKAIDILGNRLIYFLVEN